MSDSPERTVGRVLAAISVSHLLNDTIQSLIPSIYPVLKASFQLSFAQVGLISLTLQLTASILQPVVGIYTDRRAVFAGVRHGLVPRRAAAVVSGVIARRHSAGRRLDGDRLVGVSSRVVAG